MGVRFLWAVGPGALCPRGYRCELSASAAGVGPAAAGPWVWARTVPSAWNPLLGWDRQPLDGGFERTESLGLQA